MQIWISFLASAQKVQDITTGNSIHRVATQRNNVLRNSTAAKFAFTWEELNELQTRSAKVLRPPLFSDVTLHRMLATQHSVTLNTSNTTQRDLKSCYRNIHAYWQK
jgi:hypothetical protein